MSKQFKLSKDDIEPIAVGHGACFATDKITVEGFPVRFMYREDPDNEHDSGWRFMSGFEDDDYMSNPDNMEIYDVNTIANYDPSIIPHLDAAIGATFEKTSESEQFVVVTDWEAPDD
ncbi:MAG: DUF2185 domain-containing protein [Burkholderiales bacterium]|nr:DUF2185 domain-containing protein [Burkholderiales bacterium]